VRSLQPAPQLFELTAGRREKLLRTIGSAES
jgi:hypothetical protein